MTNKKTSYKPSPWNANSKLGKAVIELTEHNKTHGVIMKGGKKYTMVKDRVEIFRKFFELDLGIETSIEYCDDTFVRMKAVVTETQRHYNGEHYTDHIRVIGSGHAEELRGSTNVNKTSALENAETGAIGRALASIGLAGGEYASANEMEGVGRKEEALKEEPAVMPFKCDLTTPDGKKTAIEAGEDDHIEDLLFEAYKEFFQDCKTKEQFDEFANKNGPNGKAMQIMKASKHKDEFIKIWQEHKARVTETSEGESK